MKSRFLVRFGAVILLIASALAAFLFSTSGELYRTYSPDKQYSVFAAKYNYEAFVMRMPGGGSDASGKVFLYDEIEKKIIASGSISMVGLTGEIEWTEDEAYFKGGVYPNITNPWKLPRKVKLPYTVEKPKGTFTKYSPLGWVMHEYQMDTIAGIRLKTGIETYYWEDGTISLQYEYQYLPEKTKDGRPWKIATYKDYFKGKLVGISQKMGYHMNYPHKPCGLQIEYDGDGTIIKQDTLKDCNGS